MIHRRKNIICRAAAHTRIFLIAGVVFFGFLYLLETNTASTRGYDIAHLEAQVRGEQNEDQRLQFQIATYRSMSNIETRLQTMNFVSTDDAEYLNTAPAIVARK